MEKRKKDLGEALENLYRFLNLVAFISLLLGAVGVASAIQAHLRQKISTAAILRCLGSSARTTVYIYLLQAAAMGLAGAIAGAGWGFDSSFASARVAIVSAVSHSNDDILATDSARNADRIRGLRFVRAATVTQVPSRFAAACFARFG